MAPLHDPVHEKHMHPVDPLMYRRTGWSKGVRTPVPTSGLRAQLVCSASQATGRQLYCALGAARFLPPKSHAGVN